MIGSRKSIAAPALRAARTSAAVKAEICAAFDRCARLVVLIGETTEAHPWIEWEVRTFYDQKFPLAGPATWRRVRGMRLKGTRGGDPAALAGRATVTLDWSPARMSSSSTAPCYSRGWRRCTRRSRQSCGVDHAAGRGARDAFTSETLRLAGAEQASRNRRCAAPDQA